MRYCPVCGERIGAHLAMCPVCFEPTGFDAKPSQGSPQPEPSTRQSATPKPESKPEPTLEPDPRLRDPEPEPDRRLHDPEPEPRRYKTEPEPEPRRYEPEPAPRQREPLPNPEPQPEPQRQWPPEPDAYSAAPPPKSANPLKWLLIALIALLLIGIGLLTYFLLKGDKEGDEPPTEPREEVVAPAEAKPMNDKDLYRQRIDSVERNIPLEAYALNAYPDAEHPSLYYILDGQLMVYRAETDKTESVRIPKVSGSERVIDAGTDPDDSQYLLIDMGDKEENYTFTYKMNTTTDSFERMEGETNEATVQEQAPTPPPATPAKKSATKKQNFEEEDEYYDYPPEPYTDRRDRRRGHRVFRSEEEREESRMRHREHMERRERMRREDRQERMRRESRRADDYTPPSSGSGFHLEPVNPGQGSNSGSGIRLEKVDRIPNQ